MDVRFEPPLTGSEFRELQRQVDVATRARLARLRRWDGVYKDNQRPEGHPPLIIIERDGTRWEAA